MSKAEREIADLQLQRQTFFGFLNRVEEFLKNVKPETQVDAFYCRLDALEKNLNTFMALEFKLLALSKDAKSELAEFEERYFDCKANINKLIRERTPSSSSSTSAENNQSFNDTMVEFLRHQKTLFESITDRANHGISHVKLEPLKIKPFNGNYDQFQSFKDHFESSIHSNGRLDNVLKFQYLLKCVEGEPYELIQHISVTSDNYGSAWEKILDRYDKRKYVVAKYVKGFIDMPNITKTNTSNLRSIYNQANTVIRGLEALGDEAQSRDVWLITILLNKLTPDICKLWAQKTTNNDFPSIDAFIKFLGDQCDAHECVDVFSRQPSQPQQKPGDKIKVHYSKNVTSNSSGFSSCLLCEEKHAIYKCNKYKSMDVTGRRNFAAQNRLCFNCLVKGHSASSCRSRFSCHTCKSKHHTSLHVYDSSSSTLQTRSLNQSAAQTNSQKLSNVSQDSIQDNTIQSNQCNISTTASHSAQIHHLKQASFEHLLPTAIVNVEDISGRLQKCRILLDSGSMGNIVTESLVRKLHLPRSRTNTIVSGIAAETTVRWKTKLQISSRFNSTHQLSVDAFILNNLSFIPNQSFTKPHLPLFTNLELSDPTFNINSPIDIILNAGLFFSVMQYGNIKDENLHITAQNTLFGWVLAGDVTSTIHNESQPIQSNNLYLNIDQSLQMFWQTEEVARSLHLTELESMCEDYYQKTVKRDQFGRYIVSMPFNDNEGSLGNSINAAKSRLIAIERKLDRDPEIRSQYHAFLSEYQQLGHMEKIPHDEIRVDDSDCYYLPHHFVLKLDSTTTKLRVVFDGSCKTTSGISLNDKLLVGPKTQDDLQSIIMRFRTHNIVFCADIEKMFRQIFIEPSQRNFQRIVWRDNVNSTIDHYRLTTVTYGTSCAPFLSTRTLQQLAHDGIDSYPLAAPILKSDIYVDDLLTGSASLEEALALKNEMIDLLTSGGFNLRKFASNSKDFLNTINHTSQQGTIPILVDESAVKVLGIHWHPDTDHFVYKVSLNDSLSLTKRQFLSESSRLFDPFGWISPIIISIKIIFQGLWLQNLNWDDKLPADILKRWNNIKSNLTAIEEIRIPRQIFRSRTKLELHGFSDASEWAYSSVVYARDVGADQDVQIRIIASKTKVAPVSKISVPRLELNGAVLLSKLLIQIKSALNLDDVKIFAWTDSQIVLAWLSDHPVRWQTYVANRTSEVLNNVPRNCWRHVPSQSNPADCASRGLDPHQLVTHELWWQGPGWLKEDKHCWPNSDKSYNTEMEKSKRVFTQHTNVKLSNSNIIDQFYVRTSSYTTLIRYIAIWRRFVYNSKSSNRKQRRYGFITAEEMKLARNFCIKSAQEQCFAHEINQLNRFNQLRKKSSLSSLAPFIDEEGILRVGGRLKNATCPYDTKHPIILLNSHILSEMIITYYHKHFLHPSQSLLSTLIKNYFWIVGGRIAINKESRRCITCIRHRAMTSTQLMANLPKPRVNITRAFTHTGVDFAGPLLLSTKRGRGAKLIKGYICVFVCLSVKAIHLEVVSDLSTDAFIAAFQRFCNRRGLPSDIYTDNGTNFVGAHRKFINIFDSKTLTKTYATISEFCSSNGINWHYSPPAAPHFGGIWEAAVKSMKTHLRKIIGRAHLTFEEMTTLVIEIEGILNSRPLYPVNPSDISSLDVLTPAHFLMLGSLKCIPEPCHEDVNKNRLTRWQQIRQHVKSFWTRYNKEYLNSLQMRNKWQQPQSNFKEGDIVLIKENLPPAHWAIARVIEVYRAADGLVRSVKLKTSTTEIKRPIHVLVPLPIE